MNFYLIAFDDIPLPEEIRPVWLLISETLRWVQRQQEVVPPTVL